MNSRTASRCAWLAIGAYAAAALLASPAGAVQRKSAPAKASQEARGGNHGIDALIDTGEHKKPAKDLLLEPEEVRKSDALASFVEGLIAEENAEGEKALAAFQRVLSLDPGYSELAVKVAYEHARRGEVGQGISTLKDAIKASPKDPLPYLYLSQLYAKFLRKPELGIKYAQQALDLDPSKFAHYVALYELYSTTGQTAKADQILQRAASNEKADAQFWLQLAELHTKLFLKEDGTSTPEDLKRINSILSKAEAAAKDDPAALAKIADFHVLARQVENAIPLYLEVLKLKRSSPPDITTTQVKDKLARSFRVAGQRDQAIDLLQQIIKEHPTRYESYELLGELYEEKLEFDKALASYQQALLIDSNQPVNYLRVADMLLKHKQFDQAVDLLEEARSRFPDLPQITYNLAIVLHMAKRYADAVPIFEEALHEAGAGQQEMLNAAFYYTYGAAAERAGLYEKAAELLRKSIELDPANAAEAYNYLGYMWVDRGENLDEAGDLIRKAVEMDPDNAAFIDSLGWFHYKKGNYEKALEQLLKSAELMKPEDAVVFDHIADTYVKMNNVAQALVYWQKAAVLDPGNKEIAQKIENAKQKVAAGPPQQKQ